MITSMPSRGACNNGGNFYCTPPEPRDSALEELPVLHLISEQTSLTELQFSNYLSGYRKLKGDMPSPLLPTVERPCDAPTLVHRLPAGSRHPLWFRPRDTGLRPPPRPHGGRVVHDSFQCEVCWMIFFHKRKIDPIQGSVW